MNKFKKIPINKIQLHSKRLVSAWQYNYFKDTEIKHLDGYFIASNIFSVYVYSTNKKASVIKEFAIKIDTRISELIADSRNYINQQQQKLDKKTRIWIDLPLKMNEPLAIKIDTNKIAPSALALIKLYIAIDKHIVAAYQAKANGDISTTECQIFENKAFKNLNKLLSDIKRISAQFHKIRKENS
ncbi:hypothetical protein E4T25_08915 [Photobacterium damselae subsp. piscicida]|uniref:hypothetical protein n=1 Tax=Photobacterium damselae TaxID=38293 RepID=UPI00107645FB|nr:hypothetical protein [Photobacterium damselae]TFZ60113.1 hypothetical protein E4T25_08915 [Photobacterium damselae subsp. piscicida]